MNALYKVFVAEGLCYDAFGEFNALKKGTRVVIQCERFQELANVMRQISTEPIADLEEFENSRAQNSKGRHIEGQKTPVIIRLATEEDLQQVAENTERAKNAFQTAVDRIHFHQLEMKLIQLHYSLDRKLLVLQFSAEGRVDFRELLRDLSASFHSRVELRQIGVRDEACILGGLGTCGRPFCCTTFLPSFNSINVKMAKQQGLSLNPQSISGCCGRLRCCLQYESEHYTLLAAEQKRAAEEAAEEQQMECQPQPARRPEHANGKPSRNSATVSPTNAKRPKTMPSAESAQAGHPQATPSPEAGADATESRKGHGRHHHRQHGAQPEGAPRTKLVGLTDGLERQSDSPRPETAPKLLPLREAPPASEAPSQGSQDS